LNAHVFSRYSWNQECNFAHYFSISFKCIQFEILYKIHYTRKYVALRISTPYLKVHNELKQNSLLFKKYIPTCKSTKFSSKFTIPTTQKCIKFTFQRLEHVLWCMGNIVTQVCDIQNELVHNNIHPYNTGITLTLFLCYFFYHKRSILVLHCL
jgi:hypothetical protein